MRKYSRCVLLAVVLMAPGFAFADVQTVDFDALMTQAKDFVYEGGHSFAYLDPATADNNENGILDATEFAVLSAIFANAGNPIHTQIHEAWKANVNQADTDLGSLVRELASPWLKQIMAAYATLGDGDYQAYVDGGVRHGYAYSGSWGIYAFILYMLRANGSDWNGGAPVEANYQRKEALVSACTGDADADAVSNIAEYYGQGQNRGSYVAAALDAGITTSSAYPSGLCTSDALHWYVNRESTSGNEGGTSWPTAKETIQQGVDSAFDAGGGEVWVAEGTYTATTDPVVIMREGVHIYGGFAGNETARDQRNWTVHVTIIDGENARRCVTGADQATIDGFSVRNGYASYGGGMFNQSCSPSVTNCTFSENASDWGGGMGDFSSSPTLTNCVFISNSVSGGTLGAGMNNSASSPTVMNCTFYANGLNIVNLPEVVPPTVTNSILWGGGIDGNIANVTYSCIQGGYPGTGNMDVDPLFVDAAHGNLRLRNGSPCVDTGTSTGSPATDILGMSRPQGSGVDMGAYELLALQDVDGDGLPDLDEAAQGCDNLVADAALYATIDYPSDGALFHSTPIALRGRLSSAYVDTVFVSTNGGVLYDKVAAISGLTWSYSWTPPVNGTYSIYLKARNTFDGLTITGPATVVYHPDIPVAVIAAPVDQAHVRGAVQVTGSALAGLLGIQQYALDYHSGTDPEAPAGWVLFRTSSSEVDNGTLGSWNTSGLADGPYVLRLTVTDGTGDDSYRTHVVVYVDSDTTAPGAPAALDITSGVFPDVVSNGKAVAVRATAESNCYVSLAEVVNESGQDIKDVTDNITLHRNGSVRGTFTLPDSMTATTVALRLRVKDAAGNISGARTSNSLPVDNAPPTVQVAFPVNGATLPRDLIIVAGVAADNGIAGLEKIEFSADGSTWALATGTEAWSYHWTPSAEGPYTLHVRGTDKQGNSAEVAVNVTINSTYPSAYITSPTQGDEVNRGTTIEVVGTATDTSDFKNYRLQYTEGVSPDTYWTNLTPDPITTPVTNGLLGTWSTAGLDQGTYTLRLIVRDNAYNTVIFDMQVFVRDLPCEYTGLFNNDPSDTPPGQGPMFAWLLPTMSQPISDLFYVIGYETWRDYDIEYLDEALDHMRERPGDGLPDRFQMALVEYALCHPTSRYHEEALAGFLANRAAFVSDIEDLQGSFPNVAQLLPMADLFAGMMGTSEAMHTTIDAIIRLLTDGSTGLPRLAEYVVFGYQEKTITEPFSAQGDFDGDGVSNVTEYNDVMSTGGDIGVFIEAATDPSPFWPGNPDVPVAGAAALALLAATLAFGSAVLLRTRG